MYLSYYQLDRKPFEITTDPNFLWLGDKHKEALAVLRYALLDNKGFLLLTGDVGTGKTTLINALLNTLGQETIVATILDPGLEKEEFFSFIGKAFQLGQSFSSKGEFIIRFSDFLNRAHDERKKVLLIIDEAQRLNQELLEEIRLLSNIEKQSTKLINIFFVGQIEFNSIILEPQNSALRQRISANYDLKPLSAKETGKYIHHRLKVAGAAKPLFKPAAIREVHRFSNGYPRLTNIICDRALVTGFINESGKIGPKIIKECAGELKLQNQKSRLKKEMRPDTSPPATARPASVTRARSPFIQKVMYTILILLMATWVAIVASYFFPQYLPFQGLVAPQMDNPASLSGEEDRAESAEPPVAPKNIDSTQTTPAKIPGIEAPENPPGVKPKPVVILNPQVVPDPQMILRIAFDHSNELDTKGVETLDNLSLVLQNHPHLEISVTGYSESQGSQRYNKKMSEFTANIVKGYLVGKGISSQRIETLGAEALHSDSDTAATENQKNLQWVEIQFKNS